MYGTPTDSYIVALEESMLAKNPKQTAYWLNVLKDSTGQDFGLDISRWVDWSKASQLAENDLSVHSAQSQPELKCQNPQ